MAEVLTKLADFKHHHIEWLETKRSAGTFSSAHFKYYIHDGVKSLRLELIGDLQSSNVVELNATWETAKTTLGRRPLVLDLRQLGSADVEGRLWMEKMLDAGGACLPEAYFRTDEQSAETSCQKPPAVKLSLIGKLLSLLRGG